MKTFQQFMEQVLKPNQSKLAVAKIRASASTTRQHNRLADKHRLHTTMHLRQTAEQEKQGMKS